MPDRSQSEVIKPEVRAVSAYTLTHFEAEVKLDQNENPYEIPEDLKRRIVDRALQRDWGRYPEFVPESFSGRSLDLPGGMRTAFWLATVRTS